MVKNFISHWYDCWRDKQDDLNCWTFMSTLYKLSKMLLVNNNVAYKYVHV